MKKNKVYTLFFIITALSIFFYKSIFFDIEFNSELWKKNENIRYKMMDDVIDNCLFIGKAKSDIRNLLGTDCFKVQNDSLFERSKVLSYIVKTEKKGLNNIQFHFFNIEFTNNKVVSIEYYNPNDEKDRKCSSPLHEE